MADKFITFTRWLDKDPETGEKLGPGEMSEEVQIPAKYDVCPKCEGVGRHLNDAIREHAYTKEDFDQNPGFFEEYVKGGNGVYGVTCTNCKGKRVVLVPDEKTADSSLLKEYQEMKHEEYQQRQQDMATYRMENGYWD